MFSPTLRGRRTPPFTVLGRSRYHGARVLKPGDVVDRYEIVELLGKGGMGEVYRAHDRRLERDVALKILHTVAAGLHGSAATQAAARMLREARAVALLEHPNVVAVYDAGEVEKPEELRGTTYLAMELIKGRVEFFPLSPPLELL